MKILVTGAAGFIGFHLCNRLLKEGHQVVGIDSINDYYDVNLKYARLAQLGIHSEQIEYLKIVNSEKFQNQFQFIQIKVEDRNNLSLIFEHHSFDVVCHLAAQAGVRYSLENPMSYVDSNIVGFLNLLECLRNYNVPKLVYASSSSVYGLNEKVPFSIEDRVDHPISLYATSKKSNELMAYTYSHLFNIETIGLRFFTVYGPWGRPDMALYLFTNAILRGQPIKVFNNGNLSRDFTYIDDIIEGLTSTINQPSIKKFSLHNIGNGKPIKLLDFISAIEKATGRDAIKEFCEMQPGDVEQTWADTSSLEFEYGYKPSTDIQVGVERFIKWYIEFYKLG